MCVVPRDRTKQVFKILTEGSSKAPRRAVAVANYFTARAPPPKDIMAFGSVLQLTQHNIGEDWRGFRCANCNRCADGTTRQINQNTCNKGFTEESAEEHNEQD